MSSKLCREVHLTLDTIFMIVRGFIKMLFHLGEKLFSLLHHFVFHFVFGIVFFLEKKKIYNIEGKHTKKLLIFINICAVFAMKRVFT